MPASSTKCLQRVEQLPALVLARFLERLEQLDVVFLDKAALDLDVDAVADKRELILGEHSLVRENVLHERPALAYKPDTRHLRLLSRSGL